jgi:hypothetical protein
MRCRVLRGWLLHHRLRLRGFGLHLRRRRSDHLLRLPRPRYSNRGDDQHAVAAIGKIDPRAGAGRKHSGGGAKAAQPLHANGPIRIQSAGKLRDLAPVRIGRAEDFLRERSRVMRTERIDASRIGPQDARAVGRPQPCGHIAMRMRRKPRIARAQHPEIRILDRPVLTALARPGAAAPMAVNIPLVSPARGGKVYARAELSAAVRVRLCKRPWEVHDGGAGAGQGPKTDVSNGENRSAP